MHVIVVRGCYLALRRAVRVELTSSAAGAVYVDEPGRSLGVRDVHNVLGVPILATVGLRASTARAVDAGVLPTRLPDALARPAREVLGESVASARGSRVSADPRSTDARPLRDALHKRLLAAPFDPPCSAPGELRVRLDALLHDEEPLVNDATAALVLDELVAQVDGLGPLQPLLADPTISEIMVNGPDRVFVERNGRLERVVCELDADAIVRIAAACDRTARPPARSRRAAWSTPASPTARACTRCSRRSRPTVRA